MNKRNWYSERGARTGSVPMPISKGTSRPECLEVNGLWDIWTREWKDSGLTTFNHKQEGRQSLTVIRKGLLAAWVPTQASTSREKERQARTNMISS